MGSKNHSLDVDEGFWLPKGADVNFGLEQVVFKRTNSATQVFTPSLATLRILELS